MAIKTKRGSRKRPTTRRKTSRRHVKPEYSKQTKPSGEPEKTEEELLDESESDHGFQERMGGFGGVSDEDRYQAPGAGA